MTDKKGKDFSQGELLQAVVFASSFNEDKFLTQGVPLSLIPVLNINLIDYTLEYLISSGIQHIILYCAFPIDLIQDHMKKSGITCDIEIISNEECNSLGDALRDIDSKALIKSDFVLCSADIVANVDFKYLLEKHSDLRKLDKSCVLTLLCEKVLPGNDVRCQEDDVFAIVNDKNRVLKYQNSGGDNKFHCPIEFMKEHKNIQLLYDLLDCHVCICSPLVPQLFTENFDYESKQNFIKGILDNEEILGNTIYLDIIEQGHIMKVSNPLMYDKISQCLLKRYFYPMVPDNNIAFDTDGRYTYCKNNIYLHNSAIIESDCKLLRNVMIGQDSKICSESVITNSVVGKNCIIGRNVTLENAYIWDGVTIMDNCKVVSSIIAENVKISSDIMIPCGSLISRNKVIDSSDCIEQDNNDVDDAFLDRLGHPANNIDEVSSSECSDDEDEDEYQFLDDLTKFHDELFLTLKRSIEEMIDFENLVLEANSLKAAYGMKIKNVIVELVKVVLLWPLKLDKNLENSAYFSKACDAIKNFQSLLKNYIHKTESELDCIEAIIGLCSVNDIIMPCLQKLFHFLYNSDILSEETIISWFAMCDNDSVKSRVKPFIDWLQTAEEESEDSD